MANLVVNGKNYDLDSLSDEAKAQVTSLQFVDAELQRLNAMIAVFQTARNGYINALKPHLDAMGDDAVKVQ
ncbi:MAG: hypothetical protein A3G25_05410 [Betaproteobacteria bacterium RIFCSPLOWO2_12_FULL_63_13]|nr:MAG: hypothetical protein A3G25_05410 [Betaproteobacteria bacterium RIFCSPLOWO2_12_FULL_63_13]